MSKSKVKWLSKCEWEKILEARCRRIVGISLKTFRAKLRAGEYKKVKDDGSGLIELLMLVRN